MNDRIQNEGFKALVWVYVRRYVTFAEYWLPSLFHTGKTKQKMTFALFVNKNRKQYLISFSIVQTQLNLEHFEALVAETSLYNIKLKN